MSDYLLLKITVLEHGSVSEKCRIAEDILSVICDPVTPTPTTTPTPTPTPAINFSSIIRILLDNSPVSQNGITFNANIGDILEYNVIAPRTGTGRTMGLYIDAVQVGQIDFISEYEGRSFRYTNAATGQKYLGLFTNGNIDINP